MIKRYITGINTSKPALLAIKNSFLSTLQALFELPLSSLRASEFLHMIHLDPTDRQHRRHKIWPDLKEGSGSLGSWTRSRNMMLLKLKKACRWQCIRCPTPSLLMFFQGFSPHPISVHPGTIKACQPCYWLNLPLNMFLMGMHLPRPTKLSSNS